MDIVQKGRNIDIHTYIHTYNENIPGVYLNELH